MMWRRTSFAFCIASGASATEELDPILSYPILSYPIPFRFLSSTPFSHRTCFNEAFPKATFLFVASSAMG